MGAKIIGMKNIQIHPTAFVDPKDPTASTKFLAAEALRGKGAILLNEKGQRFGNELGRRDELTEKINKNCAKNPKVNNLPTAFMIMNNKSADNFGRPAFNFYANIKKFFTEVANVDELAKHIGCDLNVLTDELNKYNNFVVNNGTEKVDNFGKHFFPLAFELTDKFYVATITPAIHYTMGGLKIDKQAFVFSEFMERPFKGLLAAGEVSGGVHGSNRLAGNSLLDSTTNCPNLLLKW